LEGKLSIETSSCQGGQKRGLLSRRDNKPIFWSWAARTALADAEVEYPRIKRDYSHIC